MSFVKGNLSKKETGLRYTIGEKSIEGIAAPFIIWEKLTSLRQMIC